MITHQAIKQHLDSLSNDALVSLATQITVWRRSLASCGPEYMAVMRCLAAVSNAFCDRGLSTRREGPCMPHGSAWWKVHTKADAILANSTGSLLKGMHAFLDSLSPEGCCDVA